MLSLFRHVTRRSLVAARPAVATRCYSTKNEPNVDGMKETHDILVDVANTQEKEKTFGGPSSVTRPVAEVEKWKPFYANRVVKPHDFTYKARYNAPTTYFRRRAQVGPPPSVARRDDVFHQFDLDPVSLAMNPALLSHFVSDMGKVFGRNITGVTHKTQRRMGKAIRRAKMMGIIPVLSKTQRLHSDYSRSERRR
ncbi:hypothetical protein DXG01_003101 [Tephrocybe rancida]|nr:hypothetical protein DXG01_003101 [Tephrocybe rancida]